ncbi:MAG: transporter substrate-binding domain-containing protein [Acetobacteraceae bacterium]|nr:transporter substrate-binding domain-containing protein [Acetobacteraceae bacterium]
MLLRLLPLFWLLLAFPAVAQAPGASSRLDEIIARGTLRVGLTGDYRPFSARDNNTGAYSGLDVDAASGLADALGVKLEVVPTTWQSLISDLTAAKFDIGMGGISITLERQKSAFFSQPVMRAGKAAIARCADKERFDTLGAIDAPGTKVLVNPGGTNERFDRGALRRAEIVLVPDNNRVFGDLAAGRGDVVITDSVETRLQEKLHPELCAIHPDRPFDFGELAYLLPRDMPLKLFVDQWLHIAMENGTLRKLVQHWLE